MKSSSSLFPVALMRAEVLSSEFIEDTYLLKPNNSPDPTAQVALSRLGFYEKKSSQRGIPIILLHGAFSNRGIWLDSQLKGAARILLEHGFDPWMLEFRGHGDSPENNLYLKNNLELYAQYDLPAVQAFVFEQTQQKAIWLGHSSGGVCIATAVAGKYLKHDEILAVALFGTQVSHYPFSLYLPFARTLSRLWLLTKKRIINTKLGPELEPRGVGLEFIRWSSWLSRWKSKDGTSYWRQLTDATVPTIAFAAKKDKSDPARCCEKLLKAFSGPKQYHLLSKAKGFSMDYTHGNMVRGDASEQEVWPLLITWLKTLDKKTDEEDKK